MSKFNFYSNVRRKAFSLSSHWNPRTQKRTEFYLITAKARTWRREADTIEEARAFFIQIIRLVFWCTRCKVSFFWLADGRCQWIPCVIKSLGFSTGYVAIFQFYPDSCRLSRASIPPSLPVQQNVCVCVCLKNISFKIINNYFILEGIFLSSEETYAAFLCSLCIPPETWH